MLETLEPKLLLSATLVSDNFNDTGNDTDGYTAYDTSAYSGSCVSETYKVDPATQDNTHDGYLSVPYGNTLELAVGAVPAASDYHLSFKIYALDNILSGAAADADVLITAIDDGNTGSPTVLYEDTLAHFTGSQALDNINGTNSAGCCSAGGHTYIPDPEYDFTLPATLGASANRKFDITVSSPTGSTNWSYGVDDVVVTKDLGTISAAGRGTSANGVLLNFANDGFASIYVISQSTDGGSTYTPIAFANAADTGVLLTNITNDGSTYFTVDGYSPSGEYDTASSPLQITPGSGTAGVYTISSSNLSDGVLVPSADQGTSTTLTSTLTIANATVAAGSEEEAILLSLGGTVQTDTATYTPLSGALQYFETYTPDPVGCGSPTAIGDQTGGFGCTHADILGLAESWHPGDDPSGYDFNADYLVFSVTEVAHFSASVQATSSTAARDSATPAIFTITRTGDLSAAGTVHFTMSDSAAADDYTLTLADGTTVLTPDGGGTYSLVIGAGYSQGYVYLTGGTTSSSSYTPTLSLTDDYAGTAAAIYGSVTDSQPATTPLTSDIANIVQDPNEDGFSISQVFGGWVDTSDSTAATTADPAALLLDDSGNATIHFGRPDYAANMAFIVEDLTTNTALSYGSLGAAGTISTLSGLAVYDLIDIYTWIDSNADGIIDGSEGATEVAFHGRSMPAPAPPEPAPAPLFPTELDFGGFRYSLSLNHGTEPGPSETIFLVHNHDATYSMDIQVSQLNNGVEGPLLAPRTLTLVTPQKNALGGTAPIIGTVMGQAVQTNGDGVATISIDATKATPGVYQVDVIDATGGGLQQIGTIIIVVIDWPA